MDSDARAPGAVTRGWLLRLSGGAAMIGGALRIAATFAPSLPDPLLIQAVYLVVDVFLLLGLVGLYTAQAVRLGWTGMAGFVTAVVGICVLRSQASFGPEGYAAGAALTAIGAAILGVRMLLTGGPRLGPALWIAALVAGGLGPVLLGAATAQAVAGVIFGLAFCLAGAALARRTPAP